jgi:hypothetical protein
MDLAGFLIVLILIGLLILGVVGLVRGNGMRSCCEPSKPAKKSKIR